jgi:hypothetical protein
MADREYEYKNYSRVKIGWAFLVDVFQGKAYKISVTSDGFQNIRVEMEGDTLSISYRGIPWMDWIATFGEKPSVRITMPDLDEIIVSGASEVKTVNFQSAHDFQARLTGASRLEVRNMAADNLHFNVVGAGKVTGDIKASGGAQFELIGASSVDLTGSAGGLTLHSTGASHAELEKFAARSGDISLKGASTATVNLSDKMNASLSGASNLRWVGNPVMAEIHTSGASTLRKK